MNTRSFSAAVFLTIAAVTFATLSIAGNANAQPDAMIDAERVGEVVRPIDAPRTWGTDSDRDGLPDIAERLVYGTDPNDEDSDDDYLWDGPEVTRFGTDPNDPDTDGDRLTDDMDVARADPFVADADGDGLSDFVEVVEHGTDPLMIDTDGDTLSDRREVTSPSPDSLRGAFHSDPLDATTDADCWHDGIDPTPNSYGYHHWSRSPRPPTPPCPIG